MLKPSLSTLTMIACWLGGGDCVNGVAGTVDFPTPGQFTLPLMFWTFYGSLLVLAIACAVGLPADKAAFWRTFVMSLVTLMFGGFYYANLYSQAAIYGYFRIMQFLQKLSADRWKHGVVMMLMALMVAFVAGGAAWLLRRIRPPPDGDRTYRFGILHLLILSTVMACTCALLQRATHMTPHYLYTVSIAIRLSFAVCAGAGWGHPKFTWGFLAGCIGWEMLMNQSQLGEEWVAVLPAFLLEHRDNWPAGFHWDVVQELLPLYAGLATGVLAGLFHRPRNLATSISS